MPEGYIPRDLTELMNHFRNRSDSKMWVTPREIAHAITMGIPKEALIFSGFADVFLDYAERTCPDLKKRARPNALLNLAIFCLISDHGYEDGIIVDALHGEITSAFDYYHRVDKYGPAMAALSKYLNLSQGDETGSLLENLANSQKQDLS